MNVSTRILSACTTLIQTRGFNNFTMDELAAKAGITKATVYRYFNSKDDIIAATVDDFLRKTEMEFLNIIKSNLSPEQIVNNIINHIFKHGHFLFNEQSLNDMRNSFPHLLNKIDNFRKLHIYGLINSIAENNPKNEAAIDHRIAAAIITSSVQAVVNPTFLLENDFTFEKAAAQLRPILIFVLNNTQTGIKNT